LNTLNTWTFNITAGYNVLLLPQATLVGQGSFISLTQTTGKVAVDKSNNATYSDLGVGYSSLGSATYSYFKLNSFANQRFFINSLSDSTLYQYVFSVTHTYVKSGLFNLIVTFDSSADSYQYLANVTECIFNLILFFFIQKFLVNNQIIFLKF